MSIKNHLVLDHFYIDLEDGEFQFLTKMGSILKNCVHSVVKTDSDHWEGIHLMSRTQSYFEILREYTNGMFGLCLSPMRIQYADARTIQSEEPGPWFTGHRNSSDGQPWFDWMSREDIMKPDSFVAIWAMQYHMTHKQRTSPPQPPSVDKFHAFKVSVGEEHRERILASSNWLPGTAASSSDTITFHLQDRDGYPFEVEIKFVSGDQRFKFRSLDFSLYDDAEGLLATKLVNDSFGEFEFKRDGSNLQLLRKNF